MNYPEFVKSRFKSGELIAAEMTSHKLLRLAIQSYHVCWQAERLDKVKKYAIYNNWISEAAGWSYLGVSDYENLKITPQQAELLHAAIGLAGEAGELLDAVRKHVFEGQPLVEDDVIEELGDLCFYLEAACQAIQMSRADIEELNMAKLFERYKDGYSDQQAQDRADKAGAE